MNLNEEAETRCKLINNVKKDVKQLMELSATCKFIHEDNFTFTNLCCSIDSCLLYGLKKDFLNRNSTFDLLKKLSKDCKEARDMIEIFHDLESNLNTSKTLNEKDNLTHLFSKIFTNLKSSKSINPETINHYIPLYLSNLNNTKYLWIKISILNKSLIQILNFIIKNSSKYYHSYSIMSNPVDGPLLASLIAGPCAFDKYTRFKTIQNAEPDADELIRRHKLHNHSQYKQILSPIRSPIRYSKLKINQTHHLNLGNLKEFIESLHQNVKSQLIYGKNHVIVNQKEKSFAGYLSLHLSQEIHSLILNWTPNEILNGEPDELNNLKNLNKNPNWSDLIIYIDFENISYLHCHQVENLVIFVSKDGTQYPPIQFNDGSSLIQFLISLENGLLPMHKIEPDNWRCLLNDSKNPIILKKVSSNRSTEINHSILSISKHLESTQIFNDFCKNSPSKITKPNFNDFVDNFHLSPINSESNISYSTPDNNQVKVNERIVLKNVCEDIKYKILSRAFYGWLSYHKKTKTINKDLIKLLNFNLEEKAKLQNDSLLNDLIKNYLEKNKKLDEFLWSKLVLINLNFDLNLFYRLIYFNGIETNELRKKIWPYMFGVYEFNEMNEHDLELKEKQFNENYLKLISEWKPYEELIRLNEEKKSNHSVTPMQDNDSGICSDLTNLSNSNTSLPTNTPLKLPSSEKKRFFMNFNRLKPTHTPEYISSPKANDSGIDIDTSFIKTKLYNAKNLLSKIINNKENEFSLNHTPKKPSLNLTNEDIYKELAQLLVSNAILKAKYELEIEHETMSLSETKKSSPVSIVSPISIKDKSDTILFNPISPLSINFNSFSNEKDINQDLFKSFALNAHRIDKDVLRCDRNYSYFSSGDNLNKLRNVIYSYIWENIEMGYIQGMCDLIAPLLVIFDNESIVYECFKNIMQKMLPNFLSSVEMDRNFSNMRSLVQVLDHELFEHMNQRGDHTQFYFTYRWFLLDFKRELVYNDIFIVWESIWSSKKYLKSDSFQYFIALALIETYRDIILENHMDFTDIIKFFNEMSEKHDIKEILQLARDLVDRLRSIISDKYK